MLCVWWKWALGSRLALLLISLFCGTSLFSFAFYFSLEPCFVLLFLSRLVVGVVFEQQGSVLAYFVVVVGMWCGVGVGI